MTNDEGKTLIFTDIHFGIHGNSEKYLAICKDTMKWITRLCAEQSIQNVVFMGDFFDSRSSIDVKTICYASEALNELSKTVKSVYMILGNHDIYLRDSTDIHSLSAYGCNSNIKIISEPFFENGYAFLPWGYGTARRPANVPRGTNCVFMHHDFPKSFFFGNGGCSRSVVSDTSVEDRYSELNMDVGMIEEVSANGGFIFSGHVHKKRQIPVGELSLITILGSPYETEYGFGDTSCGVCIYSNQTGAFDFVENPYNKRHVEICASDYWDVSKGIDFSNCFVRLNVDVQMTFDDISKIQNDIKSRNPYSVLNTVFDFDDGQFVGNRDLSKNPTDTLHTGVTSKIEYILRSIDSADFSGFTTVEDGKSVVVDKAVLKALATSYFEKLPIK